MYRSASFRDMTSRLSRALGLGEGDPEQPLTRSWDLIVVVSATLLALALTLTGLQALRLLFAAPLVIALPGYALVAAVTGRRPLDIPERLLFSLGVSVAVAVVSGLLLNLTPWGLQTWTWALTLGCLTIGASVVAFARRNRGASASPATPALAPGRSPVSLSRRQIVLLGAAFVVLVGAVMTTRIGAETQPSPGFTQLWMLPPSNAAQPSTVQLGVKNMEGKPMTYKLSIMVNGKVTKTWPSIQLQPGATWRMTTTLPSQGASKAPVEAALYRMDAPQTVYRYVQLSPGG